MARKPYYTGEPTREAYVQHLLGLGVHVESGCLEWRYGNKSGYGMVNAPDVPGMRLITRYIMEHSLDRALEQHELVMHLCDNPPCFNRKHLVVGSSKDNQQDADRKGRSRRRGRLIVSDEQVEELRRLAMNTNLTQVELGAKFGIQQSTVSKILSNTDRVSNKGDYFGSQG